MFRAIIIVLLISFITASAQDKKVEADASERIIVEEIQINFSAMSPTGEFVKDVRLDDFVILENGRLHQPVSLRYLPANVLILIDVGSDVSYAKRRKISAEVAKNLIRHLRDEDLIAVMQYTDKIEVVCNWTSDKSLLLSKINENSLALGKKSAFYSALIEAVKFFETAKSNKHLVVITDGVDSFNNKETELMAIKTLLSSDINVHVVSWSKLQQRTIEELLKTMPNIKKIDLPPGAEPPVRGTSPTVSIKTINLDRELIKKRKEDIQRLKRSEQLLTVISEDTNGEIFLPDSETEMIEKMPQLALNIDSQYTATYIPKKSLAEAKIGEVRLIEVSSRREGLIIQGKRRLIITKNPKP